MRQRISLVVGAVVAAGVVFLAGPSGLLQPMAGTAAVVQADGGPGTASAPGSGGTDW